MRVTSMGAGLAEVVGNQFESAPQVLQINRNGFLIASAR